MLRPYQSPALRARTSRFAGALVKVHSFSLRARVGHLRNGRASTRLSNYRARFDVEARLCGQAIEQYAPTSMAPLILSSGLSARCGIEATDPRSELNFQAFQKIVGYCWKGAIACIDSSCDERIVIGPHEQSNAEACQIETMGTRIAIEFFFG